MKKFLSLLLALVLLVSSVPVQMAHATEAEEVYLEPAAATEETEAATEETTAATEEVTEETTAATEETTEPTEETTEATEETTEATEETTEPTEEVTEETTEATEETTEATEETTAATEDTTEATEETTEATEPETDPAPDPAAGFKYTIVNNATVTITGYTGTASELTIPSQIEGLPVTRIGNDAFVGNKQVTSLLIPDTVQYIARYAFAGCSNMYSIRIPASVTFVGSNAFTNCQNLTNIYIDDLKAWININFEKAERPSDVNRRAMNIYLDGQLLKDVEIPSGVKTIPERAFAYTTIETVTIGPDVTSIGASAFSTCHKLWGVHIPNGVKTIGTNAFFYCIKLQAVMIPDSVTTIDDGAFTSCKELQVAALGAGIRKIENDMFSYCTNLRCIMMTANTTQINAGAFYKCKALECGVYTGTAKQLQQVKVYPNENDPIFDLVWNCDGACCPPSLTSVKQDSKTGKPKLKWKEEICAIGYAVYRATSSKGKYTYVGSTYDLSFVDTSAKGNTKYYYIVAGITPYGTVGYASNKKSITTGCAAPALSITNSSGGYPKISWKKVSGAKKYEVYYSTSENGTYTKLTTTTSTSYTHSKAAFGKTYYYKVKTIGSSSSMNSGLSGAVTGYRILGKPDVTASFNATTGFADLKWEKISGATGYEIEYKVGSGEYQQLTTTANTSYTHQDVEIGKTYTYIVRAVSSAGKPTGVYSSADSVEVKCAKPALKSGRDPVTGKTILSWEAVRGAAQYQVYYATSKSGSYKRLATTENLTVTHTGATAGKTYYYKVRALDADGNKGSYCSVKAVTCDYPMPVITTAESNSSGHPYIKWKKVSGAKKYEVYCATSENGTYKKLTTTTSTSYTYKDASPGKGYYFKVRCYGSSTSSRSSYSEIVFAARKLSKASVAVELNSTARSAKVTWKKVTGATAYEVQCKVADGSYETLTTTTSRSFTHTGLEVGVDYTYRVKAMSGVPEANRNSSGKTVHIKCAKPVVTLSLDETSGKPSLAWETVEGAAKYQIYYATSKDGKYKKLAEVTEPGFIHEAASAGKTYYYKVRALDAAGEKGSYCSILKIKSK